MKNLLYFASDYKIGLSALLTDQLISIHDAGINVMAVAGTNEQEFGLSERIKSQNIPVIRIDGLDEHSKFSKLTAILKDIILQNRIDIVHVQNNWQLALISYVKAKIRFKRRIEVIYTLHGFRNNHPVKAIIAKLVIGSALFFCADHIICMTEYLKREFRLLSHKIHLIPLGVNEAFFTSEFIPPKIDSLRLIFPAQFREGKNQDIIIKAFHNYCIKARDSEASLILPGSGPLLGKMKELVNELGFNRQVRFPGQLTKQEIKEAYLESNIAIVGSNSETFGQSIVEPYVLGRCVLSTPVGIALEIIKEKNGFLFNDEVELENQLSILNKNRALLMKIGKENYAGRGLFSWEQVSRKYIEEFIN